MILIKPILDCNFQCSYCYQNELKIAGKADQIYNLSSIKESISRVYEKTKGTMVLHGGEPLLLPLEDMEEIFRYGKEITGKEGISMQTNIYALTDEHIELFKRYKISVGVSIDGSIKINQQRGRGTQEERVEQHEVVEGNIKKLLENNISVGIISVITKKSLENIDLMKEWVLKIKSWGISSGRMNPIQCNNFEIENTLALSPEEAQLFYSEMFDFITSDEGLLWQPFRDIIDKVLGNWSATCSFEKCDYYASSSAHVIYGDGSEGGCCRSTKEGNKYIRPDREGFEREWILPQLPQSLGGCKDCSFWTICHGGCPGQGIDGDFRKRFVYCSAWKTMFEKAEKKIKGLIPNIELRHTQPFIYMTGDNPSSWRQNCRKDLKQSEPPKQYSCGSGHLDTPHIDYNRHEDHTDRR